MVCCGLLYAGCFRVVSNPTLSSMFEYGLSFFIVFLNLQKRLERPVCVLPAFSKF